MERSIIFKNDQIAETATRLNENIGNRPMVDQKTAAICKRLRVSDRSILDFYVARERAATPSPDAGYAWICLLASLFFS